MTQSRTVFLLLVALAPAAQAATPPRDFDLPRLIAVSTAKEPTIHGSICVAPGAGRPMRWRCLRNGRT